MMIPAMCVVIVIIIFCRAVANPSNENLVWLVFGAMCLLLDLAMILYGRIVGAEWSARENALRLELLMMDIRDKAKN
jgi:hypothetical protein